jgi:hypothetical protein
MTMSDVSVIPVCTYARARDVDMQTSVTSDMARNFIVASKALRSGSGFLGHRALRRPAARIP